MAELPEDKKIILTTDYKDNTINMEFSDNLVDNREKGYILSAAFLALLKLTIKPFSIKPLSKLSKIFFLCYFI